MPTSANDKPERIWCTPDHTGGLIMFPNTALVLLPAFAQGIHGGPSITGVDSPPTVSSPAGNRRGNEHDDETILHPNIVLPGLYLAESVSFPFPRRVAVTRLL